VSRAFLVFLLLVGRQATAAPGAEVRARVHALESLLDEEDYAGARAAYEELRAQHADASESLDFLGGTRTPWSFSRPQAVRTVRAPICGWPATPKR
jgi:hypothetical protein